MAVFGSAVVLRKKVEGFREGNSIKTIHATFRGAHPLGFSKWQLSDGAPTLSPGKPIVVSGSQARDNVPEKVIPTPLPKDMNVGTNFRPGDVRTTLPHLD